MPFQKGNTLWTEGVKAKRDVKARLEEFMLILASGGIDKYADLMDSLANNKALSKTQQEFMDRMEGWREFITPKLARSDVTSGGEKIQPLQVIVQRFEKDKPAS